MFVSIEEARSRILCPIYGAMFHFHVSRTEISMGEMMGFREDSPKRPEPINGLTLSPCCRADRCAFWRWRSRGDREAIEERFVEFDGDLPTQEFYLGDGCWTDEQLTREAEEERLFLAAIEEILEAWAPELEGWRLDRKTYDEEEIRVFAVFKRDKGPEARFGYCGQAGRPEAAGHG